MKENANNEMMDPPAGKSVMGTSLEPLNPLEESVISELDEDKVNDLAKCLFTLNNRRYGAIAGAYVVVCTKPEEEWCVGQLNADRAKPIILYQDKIFNTPEAAQDAATELKLSRGESAPCRNH
jgi:hypothetical protein